MRYDAVVIGAGLSGLTAAALMAKRGLRVAVIDRSAHPGGSCGAFRRGDAFIDQGAAMLFGFGRTGFNPHRFVFDALEMPIDVIRHESMYAMEFAGRRIEFGADLDRFTDDLADLFPGERDAVKRFYADMHRIYEDVIAETPTFTTPDETDARSMLPQVKAHPRSYFKFLRLMNRSVQDLLGHYFADKGILQFFDKLCSTYCYTTAAETPAVLGAVMFVDNHVGGTYYPVGSTVMLPGKLEQVIEEHDGTMLMGREVERILFERGRPCGVACRRASGAGAAASEGAGGSPGSGEAGASGWAAGRGNASSDADRREEPSGGEAEHLGDSCLFADFIVYGGNVWDLYERLLPSAETARRERAWAAGLVPTAASAVVYLVVDAEAIPADALPVEMFAEHPERLSDEEITAYVMSIDDPSLCASDEHVLTVVGPCFDVVDDCDAAAYAALKEKLLRRFLGVLERRFPGISKAVRHAETATPRTLERYAGKRRGAVAGPKQMMGQHLLKRQHTRTKWETLLCCGESTVMGTGTPTVTISGIAAANAVLRARGLRPFAWEPDMPAYVRDVPPRRVCDGAAGGDAAGAALSADDNETALVRAAARRCLLCERPRCNRSCPEFDVPGIMRRAYVGNFVGARQLAERGIEALGTGEEPHPGQVVAAVAELERACVQARRGQAPAPIAVVVAEALAR